MSNAVNPDVAKKIPTPPSTSQAAWTRALAGAKAPEHRQTTGGATGGFRVTLMAATTSTTSEAGGTAANLPVPASVAAQVKPVLDPNGNAALTKTYIADLKAGKTVQQIQNSVQPTEQQSASLNNALEELGISNRQIAVYAKALHPGNADPVAGAAGSQTELTNQLVAVLRERTAIDGDSAAELREFDSNPEAALPASPQIGSIQGAIQAFRQGDIAGGVSSEFSSSDAAALLYVDKTAHDPAAGAVGAIYTDGPTTGYGNPLATSLTNPDIAAAATEGHNDLVETTVPGRSLTSTTDTTKPKTALETSLQNQIDQAQFEYETAQTNGPASTSPSDESSYEAHLQAIQAHIAALQSQLSAAEAGSGTTVAPAAVNGTVTVTEALPNGTKETVKVSDSVWGAINPRTGYSGISKSIRDLLKPHVRQNNSVGGERAAEMMKSGKTIQQIYAAGLTSDDVDDGYELLGISNRQIGILAKTAAQGDVGQKNSKLVSVDGSKAETAMNDAVQMRAAVDGNSGKIIAYQQSHSFFTKKPETTIEGFQSVETAIAGGLKESGKFVNSQRASREFLYGDTPNFATISDVAVVSTNATSITPAESAFGGGVSTGTDLGRRALKQATVATSATPNVVANTGIPEPPLLSTAQVQQISLLTSQNFRKVAEKAPKGSDLNITYQLLQARNLEQNPSLKAHVDATKINSSLETYLSKPDIEAAYKAAANSAAVKVTGKSLGSITNGLSNWLTSLPDQPGFITIDEKNPSAIKGMVEPVIIQLSALDPLKAQAAQATFVKNIGSGSSAAQILKNASPTILNQTIEALSKSLTQPSGGDDFSIITGLSRFFVSGLNAVLTGYGLKSAAAQENAIGEMIGAVIKAFVANPDLANNKTGFLAAVTKYLPSTPAALGILKYASNAGILGSIASAASFLAFGVGVSKVGTSPSKILSSTGNFLLGVSNLPNLLKTAQFVANGGLKTSLATLSPIANWLGLTSPLALVAWTGSYSFSANTSLVNGNYGTFALQGVTAGSIGAAYFSQIDALSFATQAALTAAQAKLAADPNNPTLLRSIKNFKAQLAVISGAVAPAIYVDNKLGGYVIPALSAASTAVGGPFVVTGALLLLAASTAVWAYTRTGSDATAQGERLLKSGVGDGQNYYSDKPINDEL
jgi:hypothetical protein